MLISISYARFFHPSYLLPSPSSIHQRPLLCRTHFLPSLGVEDTTATTLGRPWRRTTAGRKPILLRPCATLLESPVIWAGRMCVFYLLIKAGLAGSPSSPLVSDSGTESVDDYGFSKWLESWQGGSDDKDAVDRRKLVSKWHPTTRGTLRRSYRVPSKQAGQRLLKAVASLLSEDDHFIDATSHKGCQIRRESAHGESVCCNNVRALFDELPTPHLVVEITAFPAGPLTEKDYVKAEKLEKVLRSGSSI